MASVEQIASTIYGMETLKSPRDFIDIFQKHELEINSNDYKLSRDSYDSYSRLFSDYGIALADTKNYRKAIPVIEKSLFLFDNNTAIYREELPNIQFYETLLFKLGVSLYHTGNFKSARSKFELLINLYPNNSIYLNWVRNKKQTFS